MARFVITIDVKETDPRAGRTGSQVLQYCATDIGIQLDGEGLSYTVKLDDPVGGPQVWESLDEDFEVYDHDDDMEYLV